MSKQTAIIKIELERIHKRTANQRFFSDTKRSDDEYRRLDRALHYLRVATQAIDSLDRELAEIENGDNT